MTVMWSPNNPDCAYGCNTVQRELRDYFAPDCCVGRELAERLNVLERRLSDYLNVQEEAWRVICGPITFGKEREP